MLAAGEFSSCRFCWASPMRFTRTSTLGIRCLDSSASASTRCSTGKPAGGIHTSVAVSREHTVKLPGGAVRASLAKTVGIMTAAVDRGSAYSCITRHRRLCVGQCWWLHRVEQ